MRALCPHIAQARTLVQHCRARIHLRREREDGHERAAGKRDAWLRNAEHSGRAELRGFAGGVRRALAAVRAARTREWRQGQTAGTAGQVNRLKTLQRQL